MDTKLTSPYLEQVKALREQGLTEKVDPQQDADFKNGIIDNPVFTENARFVATGYPKQLPFNPYLRVLRRR